MSDSIRISEIFGPTIQGEGALIGQPTVFVRTGGCDYRCSWCDTLYAVESRYRKDWKPVSAAYILSEVEKLTHGKPIMITLSGGNPAIQPLQSLLNLGRAKGHRFCMETQGSIAQDWFSLLDVLTLSPKPPSSGMATDWDVFDTCINKANTVQMALKIVVFDACDYEYAKEASRRYPQLPVYLQPGNHNPSGEFEADEVMERMRWLINKTIEDGWFDATILPQLHTMIWGNKRGV